MLERFLDLIIKYVPVSPLSGIEEKLSKLDPDKIYVENVRSILNVSYNTALQLCEQAVGQGYFKRGIEIKCPDETVAKVVYPGDKIPDTVKCLENEEGFYKEVDLPTKDLDTRPFYILNDAAALKQTA